MGKNNACCAVRGKNPRGYRFRTCILGIPSRKTRLAKSVDRCLENLRVLNFKVEIPKVLRAQTFIRRIEAEKLEIK